MYLNVQASLFEPRVSEICVFNCMHSCSVKHSGKQFLQLLPSFKVWPDELVQAVWSAVTALRSGTVSVLKAKPSCLIHHLCNSSIRHLHIPQTSSEIFTHSLIILLPLHHVICLKGWDLAWADGSREGSLLFPSCNSIPVRMWPLSITYLLHMGWKKGERTCLACCYVSVTNIW